MSRDQTQRLTEAITRSMGTRWCSSCCADRPADDGKWSLDKTGKRRRWRCAACVQRALNKLPHKGWRK